MISKIKKKRFFEQKSDLEFTSPCYDCTYAIVCTWKATSHLDQTYQTTRPKQPTLQATKLITVFAVLVNIYEQQRAQTTAFRKQLQSSQKHLRQCLPQMLPGTYPALAGDFTENEQSKRLKKT